MATLKQLKGEITQAIGTKAKPIHNKTRWYHEALEMIDGMRSLITDKQYASLKGWAQR